MTVGSRLLRFPAKPGSHHRIVIASGDNVRAFTIKPWVAIMAGAAAALFGVLYFAATGYLVFRDDLLAASLARQARMQLAYEDRIANLRSDIDRLTSRQLLNQEAFEDKLDHLVGRQAALDARQNSLASLGAAARDVGVVPPATATPSADAPLTTGSIDPAPAADRLPLAVAMLRTDTAGDHLPESDASAQLDGVESSLDALAGQQVAYVETVAAKVAERADRIGAVLKRLGRNVPREETGEGSVGGPFIPIAADADPETFQSSVTLVNAEIDRLSDLRSVARKLPLTKPVSGAAITSGFGPRLDPFLHQPAMHTGIDFQVPIGFPVRTTSAGTVVSAEYTGGYGFMVEVSHGGGVSTRYGHLSQILVKPGQVVAKGAIVGRAGSSGRSTGPHLHYEVRTGGQAIDPMIFIKAGNDLSSLL